MAIAEQSRKSWRGHFHFNQKKKKEKKKKNQGSEKCKKVVMTTTNNGNNNNNNKQQRPLEPPSQRPAAQQRHILTLSLITEQKSAGKFGISPEEWCDSFIQFCSWLTLFPSFYLTFFFHNFLFIWTFFPPPLSLFVCLNEMIMVDGRVNSTIYW